MSFYSPNNRLLEHICAPIQGLSQQHKRLCSLADHAPHGYRRKSLFEVLIRNNVPLVRAAWFIKVTYLNQVWILFQENKPQQCFTQQLAILNIGR